MDRKKKKTRVLANVKTELMETLEARQLLSTSAANLAISSDVVHYAATSTTTSVEGYTPAEIRAAYDITGTGAGQTVAIVDAYSDPNIASDLAVFDKEFDLPSASLTQVSSTGSTTKLPAENAGWDGEISLDVEWLHAVAPDAKIVLVDASSDSISSLMSAVNYARNISGVSVVSMSWGGSEFSGESSYDSYFTTPSGHTNITFVAASGDDGAAGGAEYPASSPNVVAVGGTTLTLSSSGSAESQTAWTDSEGGVSAYESEPSYQSSAGISSSGKSSPDVSYDADPDTGFAVYDSVADDGYVGWQEVGGTSAGTPQWSGIIAIADAARASNGLGTLSSSQTLSELYSLYSNPTTYAQDFTDITSGSSVESGGGFGGPFGRGGRFGRSPATEVSATSGYDTLTGIGAPKVANLVAAMSTASVSNSSLTKSSATRSSVTASTTTKASKAKFAVEMERSSNDHSFEQTATSVTTLNLITPGEWTVEVATTPLAPTAHDFDAVDNSGALTASAQAASVSPTMQQTDQISAESQAPFLQAMLSDSTQAAKQYAAEGANEAALVVEQFAKIEEKTAAAIPSLFSQTLIAARLADAMNEASEMAGAMPRLTLPTQHRSASTDTAIGVALAADAVLLGYLQMKRKGKRDESAPLADNWIG